MPRCLCWVTRRKQIWLILKLALHTGGEAAGVSHRAAPRQLVRGPYRLSTWYLHTTARVSRVATVDFWKYFCGILPMLFSGFTDIYVKWGVIFIYLNFVLELLFKNKHRMNSSLELLFQVVTILEQVSFSASQVAT